MSALEAAGWRPAGVLQQLGQPPVPGAVVRHFSRVELREAFCSIGGYPPMSGSCDRTLRVPALRVRDGAPRFPAPRVRPRRHVRDRHEQLIVEACSRQAGAMLGVREPAVVDVWLEEYLVGVM